MGRYGRRGGRYDRYESYWPEYVPVAQRRANALKDAQKIAAKEKRELFPVRIEGKKITTTFWGNAWCQNLERYSDFSNRLPRGKSYVRNGSVIDMQISRGKISAIVAGSSPYRIAIAIDSLSSSLWSSIKRGCSSSIGSLVDLLQARFDQGVMERITRPQEGLFPDPKQIKMSCSCPDYAGLCKHLAAVMYGIGNRLDKEPALLFLLRSVDHLELVDAATKNLDSALVSSTSGDILAGGDLSELFGIEIDTGSAAKKPPATGKKDKAPKKGARQSTSDSGKSEPEMGALPKVSEQIPVATPRGKGEKKAPTAQKRPAVAKPARLVRARAIRTAAAGMKNAKAGIAQPKRAAKQRLAGKQTPIKKAAVKKAATAKKPR